MCRITILRTHQHKYTAIQTPGAGIPASPGHTNKEHCKGTDVKKEEKLHTV